MASGSDLDTDYVDHITQYASSIISDFVPYPSRLIANTQLIDPVTFGNRSHARQIPRVNDDITIDRGWVRTESKQSEPIPQRLDVSCLGDSVRVPEVDIAGNPALVATMTRDLGRNFIDGIEHFFFQHTNGKVVNYGLLHGNATAVGGTVNAPDGCTKLSSHGNWDTTSNIRTDLINALIGLKAKKFYGPYIACLPAALEPVLADVLSSTAVTTKEWIKGGLNLDYVFTPAVDPDATKDAFDVLVIDAGRCHLGMSPIRMKTWFDYNTHEYVWDWEAWGVVYYDPLYDGSEWKKGTILIESCDYSD